MKTLRPRISAVLLLLAFSSQAGALDPSSYLPSAFQASSSMSNTSVYNSYLADQMDYLNKISKAKANGGCYDTDGGNLTGKGYPMEPEFETQGTVYRTFTYGEKDSKGKNKYYNDSKTDECVTNYLTGQSNLREYFCSKDSDNQPVINYKDIVCRTGTTCSNGACVQSGYFSCNGAQKPFLDSNGNGEPDACTCQDNLYPSDSDKDGNSDSCSTRPDLCSLPQNQILKMGFIIKGDTTQEGVKQYLDRCTDTFTLEHVVCSLDNTKTTSKGKCAVNQVCDQGNCIDVDQNCNPENANVSSTGYGYIKVTPPGGFMSVLGDYCGDKCADLKGDVTAYSKCLNNPLVPDVVENAYCPSPIMGMAAYTETKCAAAVINNVLTPTETCQLGVCVPISGTNTGSPNKSPGTPDPSQPGGSGDPSNPCSIDKVTFNCSEPSDSTHPIDPAYGQLYGDPKIYGETKMTATADIKCTGTALDLLMKALGPQKASQIFADACQWDQDLGTTMVNQWGCSYNAPANSVSPCDWPTGYACDRLATKSSDSGFGACVKPTAKASMKATSNSLGKTNGYSGTTAFNHQVNHPFTCLSDKQAEQWVVADNSEGLVRSLVTCGADETCNAGLCQKLPCAGVKVDDSDPCTTDVATNDLPNNKCYVDHYPWEGIDDANGCTADSCATDPKDKTKAVVTHTPLTGGNCSGWYVCQQDPKKCQTDPAKNNPPSDTLNCDDPNSWPTPGVMPANCQTTFDNCSDSDMTNDIIVKGVAVMFPGKSNEKMAQDTCTNLVTQNGKSKYTSVMQVACGANTKFYFKTTACNPGQVCVDGACVKE